MSQNSDGYEMIMSLRDWRQAIRTPTAYRVGNSTFRIQTQLVSAIAVLGFIVLLVLYTFSSPNRHRSSIHLMKDSLDLNSVTMGHVLSPINAKHLVSPVTTQQEFYNSTYPLTPPMKMPKGISYRIGIISDMDKKSKSTTEENTWISYFKKGYLVWNPKTKYISVTWDSSEPVVLKSNLGESGRGMELSELVTFNGKLLAVDDRTGIVYEIHNEEAIPWIVLTDGDGRTRKGFKMEWAAVRNRRLWLGGLGKEWTSPTGELINLNPQWIKVVAPSGEVSPINWREKYNKLRRAVGIEFPGYMIHEAVCWSPVHRQWIFLPRRASTDPYNEHKDEEMGTNMILTADEEFQDIKVTRVGEVVPTRGFSSFKFLPDTGDNVVVALRTLETRDRVATFITAFTLAGAVLLPDTLVADQKFEGFEFI